MIVIFGASSDLGQRLIKKLRANSQTVRAVSTRPGYDAIADLSTGLGVSESIAGSQVVVSCAHARYSGTIINHLPSNSIKLVLTGSAWRYSKVPNDQADQVRSAEAAFMASKANGYIIHPAMIYGGNQENNIRRMLGLIRRFPLIPMVNCGRQIVQPIYIDDVVECLFSAINLPQSGKRVIPIGGPPMSWREMVEICCAAIGVRRPFLNVPPLPMIALLSILNALGFKKIHANSLRRLGEDVNIPINQMTEILTVSPRHFNVGLRLAVAAWREERAFI